MVQFAYPRVAARIFGRPLAIDPPRLKTIMDALGDRIVLGAEDSEGEELPSRADIMRRRLGAIAGGRIVDVEDGMGEYCVTDGGVAVIPVLGPLSQRFDWFAAVCGFATYDGIGATLDAVLEDSAVRAVLFDHDSPGGECFGMLDLADKILAARAVKPIWAVANGLAASADYALAGSAGRLIVPRMGYVGSIGVVAIHVDRTEQDKQIGLKYTAVYSGARKVDGWSHAPLSKDAKDRLQADIDGARRMFADLVGRQGRIDQQGALDTEADVYRDDDAVKAGLADEVMSFEEALGALTDLAASRPANGAVVRFTTTSQKGTAMTDKPKAGNEPDETTKLQADIAAATTRATTAEAALAAAEKERDTAKAEAARTKEIVELCSVAQRGSKVALKHITSNASVSAVREALLNDRADASDRDPIDPTPPPHDQKTGNHGWDAVVTDLNKKSAAR
jgi:ClpP class serine protease